MLSQSSDDTDEDENDFLVKYTIRRYQFDHNQNTCMTHNYPEAAADDDGRIQPIVKDMYFAPGEGHHPANILEEKDWDIQSWPILLPDGNFGLHYPRRVRLTDQQYFCQRIFNKDLRFGNQQDSFSLQQPI